MRNQSVISFWNSRVRPEYRVVEKSDSRYKAIVSEYKENQANDRPFEISKFLTKSGNPEVFQG